MGRTACTEPQCLYSTAIPLLPLWAVRPAQSLGACTVQLYLYSPYGPYGLYRASVPVQYSYTSTPSMGRTACTEHQCLYRVHIYTSKDLQESVLFHAEILTRQEHTVLGIKNMLTCHFSIRCLQFPIWDSRLLDTHMGLTNQSSSTRTYHIGFPSRNAHPADSQHCAPPSSVSSAISLKTIFPRMSQ